MEKWSIKKLSVIIGLIVTLLTGISGFIGAFGASRYNSGVIVTTLNKHNEILGLHTEQIKTMDKRLDDSAIDRASIKASLEATVKLLNVLLDRQLRNIAYSSENNKILKEHKKGE